ncbi:hypothetical protein AB0M12_38735 [Nocardia vinacea]|uniref:hypothetical protein n=1 Tax=Nocardia vinacea TaxID=96468 RepID=UPI00342838D3
MNGLTVHQWWFRAAVFAAIAVWRIYQTGRRPSLVSALITVVILATAANLILESAADAESQKADGRPFIMAAIQAIVLLIAWCATCAYYAHAEATKRGWRISVVVVGFAALTCMLVVAASTTVSPGIRLTDYTSTAVVRYYSAVFAFFPAVQAVSGYLAIRAARRSRNPLRAAMALASVGLWMLALSGWMLIAEMWIQHSWHHPTAALPVSKMLYFVGTVGWVVSFGAVAAAHRARQLSALWRAIRENRLLRGLLRDLEALSPPALTYPRTGWTPLLMRPHSALLRTRIECRDRLLTLSPHLGEGLDTAERQHPEMVAAALSQLRQRHDSVDLSRPTRPLALLTADTLGADPLVELARSYTQLTQN